MLSITGIRTRKDGLPPASSRDRTRSRIERQLAEARLPAGKTLATFEFESVPILSKAQAMGLASSDVWLKTAQSAAVPSTQVRFMLPKALYPYSSGSLWRRSPDDDRPETPRLCGIPELGPPD
ncbi:hypothetical protein [Bradyrhizobium sp. 150]|uniref:hypothetical protein n=1 Tax=Bradyrhizobium sp. 150 TaxID=2782625 RepID=UPI0031F6E50D|nr:hypothetical protein [Bradyrhizobium sp. 150]